MSWVPWIKIDFVDWKPSWCLAGTYWQLEDEIRKNKIIKWLFSDCKLRKACVEYDHWNPIRPHRVQNKVQDLHDK